MITTELNRAEFTGNGSSTEYVFATEGTDIPVKNEAHIKVYLTNTGTFTANSSTNVFTNVTLDGSAQTSHGHLDTQVIRVSAGTALPTGLLGNTDYYVRDKDTTTFKVALSSGGTAVAITDTGTGTLTWTKTLLKTLVTDYTVTFSGTTATVIFGTPPPNTVGILLLREVPFEQNTDLQNNSQLEAESLESQLDLIVNQTQQLKNKTARDLKLSDTLIASDATEASATLNVTSANRASKALKFDSSGNLGVSVVDVDLAEDYVLEAKSYATESPAVVNSYSGTVATPLSGVYSAKEHAVGTPTDGSSKEWATTVDAFVTGSLSSAKEYAQGDGNSDAVATGGSAKGWSQDTAKVNGATTNDRSAKAWSQGASMTGSTLGGSSKDWAQKTDGAVNTTFSAKEYAQGTTSSTGGSSKDWAVYTSGDVRGGTSGDMSSKEWAVGTQGRGIASEGLAKDWATLPVSTGTVDNASYSAKEYSQSTTAGTSTYGGSAKGWASTAYDAAVPGAGSSDRSALHYSTDASNSAVAAKNSAAAVANSFDSFDDTYLGKMVDNPSFTANASTDFITSNAHGLVDTQIIRLTGSDLPDGLSASTDYHVRDKTTNTFKLAASAGAGAINIVDAGSGTNTWYYGDVVTPTSSSWTKNSSTITVASNIGIIVGQVVSGSGIPVNAVTKNRPNVLSIDSTSIVISENMANAGSSVAVTFASRGINGAYNTSTDGPSTNNDGDTLASGNLFFNSTDNEMRIFDGANWIAATSAGSTSLIIYKYVASGSQTTFTGADANGASLSYTADNINVFLNGVRLDATDYTASNGTSVVLGAGATASDELVVTAYKSFTTADMVSASAGGTFNNNVSFGDNNITNVGDIALDTITADGSSIIVNTDTALAAGVDIETSTTGKVKQKGAFMQSSTHQALTLGG